MARSKSFDDTLRSVYNRLFMFIALAWHCDDTNICNMSHPVLDSLLNFPWTRLLLLKLSAERLGALVQSPVRCPQECP